MQQFDVSLILVCEIFSTFIFIKQGVCLKRSLHLEAVAQRCSIKKVFLETSQNSQENTYVRVCFLIELNGFRQLSSQAFPSVSSCVPIPTTSLILVLLFCITYLFHQYLVVQFRITHAGISTRIKAWNAAILSKPPT